MNIGSVNLQRLWAIAQRELYSQLVTPGAYFLITSFLFLCAYFFFNLLGSFNLLISKLAAQPYVEASDIPNLNQWVIEPYFQSLIGLLIFIIPIFSMRSLAEERQKGTAEMLLTSNCKASEIVIGKFVALSLFLSALTICSSTFPFLLVFFGEPEKLPILAGVFGLILYGSALASVGIAISAACDSQLLAGGLTTIALLLLFVVHSPAEALGGGIAEVLFAISPAFQVREFVRGVISMQALIYFSSLCVFSLFLAQHFLLSERNR